MLAPEDFLVRPLAKYTIPKEDVFVGGLSRTPCGQVVKADLAEQYQQRAQQTPAP